MSKRTWIEFGIAMGIMAVSCGGSAEQAAPPTTAPTATVAARLDGKAVNLQQVSDGTIVTVDHGRQDGVAVGWRVTFLANGTDKPLAEFEVIEVTDREAIGKVAMDMQTLMSAMRRDGNVVLEAP